MHDSPLDLTKGASGDGSGAGAAKRSVRKRSGLSAALPHAAGTPRLLRASNRSLLLNLIRIRQPISRVDLARRSGLTKGTVSNIVNHLIAEGLLQEISIGPSTGGRPPTLLKLASDRNLLGAVELRPRLTTLVVATLDGTILRRASIETGGRAPEAFLAACAVQVRGMLKQFVSCNVVGVGLTVPGTVSYDRRRIVSALDLGWEDVSIEAAARELPWPLILENDANAVALAELYFGESPWQEGLVSVVLNDSLGSGIIAEGRLFRGANGHAGEVGHMLIDPAGEPCTCGRRGCLGMYASGHGAVHRYKIAHLRQTRRENPVQPVRVLAAETVSRGVRLRWEDAVAWPRQYDVYRSEHVPVPTDETHRVGTTVQTTFLDLPPDDRVWYYVVVSTDLNGRRSHVSDVAGARPGAPDVQIDDRFPDALPAYTVQATVPPRAAADGLDVGTAGQDHQCTMLWRGDVASAEVTGVVRPLTSGVFDTSGVLVKVQDAQHWYCALLAYGDQLALGHTLSVMRQTGGGDEWLAFYPITVEPGQAYTIRVWTAPEWIRVKAWPEWTAEPAEWQLSIRDDSDWTGGGVGFRCYGKQVRLHRLYVERSAVLSRHDTEARVAVLDHTEPALRLILEQARQGDPVARTVLAETGRYLALGLTNLYAAFGISRFRLSGRLVDGWDLFAPALHEALAGQSAGMAEPLDVRPSTLGPEAGVLGAIGVASLPLFDTDLEEV